MGDDSIGFVTSIVYKTDKIMFLNYVCSIDERNDRQRPYNVESTGSRLITEVKQLWACLVLGWETTLETRVLLVFFFAISNDIS